LAKKIFTAWLDEELVKRLDKATEYDPDFPAEALSAAVQAFEELQEIEGSEKAGKSVTDEEASRIRKVSFVLGSDRLFDAVKPVGGDVSNLAASPNTARHMGSYPYYEGPENHVEVASCVSPRETKKCQHAEFVEMLKDQIADLKEEKREMWQHIRETRQQIRLLTDNYAAMADRQ
jgi:hypothetical protein